MCAHCSIVASRHGNTVLFHHEGGVDVGDVDAKAAKVEVDIEEDLAAEQARELVREVSQEKQEVLVDFLQLLYRAYSELYFTLLEINPLGVCVRVCVHKVIFPGHLQCLIIWRNKRTCCQLQLDFAKFSICDTFISVVLAINGTTQLA